MRVREAIEADIPDLLRLMRELARFEKYADAFAVTEEVLREQGFRHRRIPGQGSWQTLDESCREESGAV